MSFRRGVLWAAVLWIVALCIAGCGGGADTAGGSGGGGGDAGTDAGNDAATDAGNDAATVPVLDATHSTVTVDRATGVTADGSDEATITVTLLDASDAPIPGLAVAITATGDGDVIGQPAPNPTDVHGVAHATLASTVAESKTIGVTVTTTAGSVTLTAHPTVQFVPGAAATLAFSQPPTDVVAGAAIAPAPVVTVKDAHGNLVAGAVAVTVALGANPGNAALSGTTTSATASGNASFADLHLDKAGAG